MKDNYSYNEGILMQSMVNSTTMLVSVQESPHSEEDRKY